MPYGPASRAHYAIDLHALALCFPTVPSNELRCILAHAPFFAAAQGAIQVLLDVDTLCPSNGPRTRLDIAKKYTARKDALLLLDIPAPRAEYWARSDARLAFALATMLGPEPAYLAGAKAETYSARDGARGGAVGDEEATCI